MTNEQTQMGRRHIAGRYVALFYRHDTVAGAEDDVMDTFIIDLRKNPFESQVHMNGQTLRSVTKVTVSQDARSRPLVKLELDPRSVLLVTEADPQYRFSRSEGYDPYNSIGV